MSHNRGPIALRNPPAQLQAELTAERRERIVHPLRDLGADGVIEEHSGPVSAPALANIDAPFVKADKRPRPIFLDPYRATAYRWSGCEFMKDEAGRREDRGEEATSYTLPPLPVSVATFDHIRAGDGACAVMHIPRPRLLGAAGITGEMPGLAGQDSRIEWPELEKTIRSRVGKADYSIVFTRRAAISTPAPSRPHRPAISPEAAGVLIRAVLGNVDVNGLGAWRLGRVDVVGAGKDMIRADKDACAD